VLSIGAIVVASTGFAGVVVPAGAETAVVSVVDGAARLDGNRRGVITMTSAIKASASSVRLSMQVVELP